MDVQIPIDNFMSDDLKAAINYLNQNSAAITGITENDVEIDTSNISTETEDDGEIGGQDVDFTGISFGEDQINE